MYTRSQTDSTLRNVEYILYEAFKSQNEETAIFCILLFREFLRERISDPRIKYTAASNLTYLSTLVFVRRALDAKQYCEACNRLSDFLALCELNRSAVRDSLLKLLYEHPNLQHTKVMR